MLNPSRSPSPDGAFESSPRARQGRGFSSVGSDQGVSLAGGMGTCLVGSAPLGSPPLRAILPPPPAALMTTRHSRSSLGPNAVVVSPCPAPAALVLRVGWCPDSRVMEGRQALAHVHTHMHTYAHRRTQMHTCAHTQMHTHALTRSHMHTDTHPHTQLCTHMRAHRHTGTHRSTHAFTLARAPEAGQGVGLPSAPGPASRPARSLTRPRPSVLRGPREVSSVVRMARGGRGPGGAGQRTVPTRGHLRAGPSFASTAVRPAIAMATAPCRLGEQPTALRGAVPTRPAAAASDFGSRCSRRSPALGGWVFSRFSVSAASPDARAPDLNPHWPESLRLDLASSRPGPAARWVPCRAPGMRSEGRSSGDTAW